MSNHLDAVEAVIRATAFHSPTEYSWFGRGSGRLSARTRRALTPAAARDYLASSLQHRLYADFYSPGVARPSALVGPTASPLQGAPDFVQQLSAANAGSGFWEGGWLIGDRQGDQLRVRRAGLELLALPEECSLRDDGTIEAGQEVALRFPKEFPAISPGFYMALGDNDLARGDAGPLVRLYWNLSPEGAVSLMRAVTSRLNQASLPFRLKAINDPARYVRCDAVVLYLQKRDYGAIRQVLERGFDKIEPYLKGGTPAFTKQLAPGVGLAEDPGSGESFGAHRCGLLAEALIRAHELEVTTVSARLQVTQEHFGSLGISLDRPFLNPGSSDEYEFQPRLGRRSRGEARTTAPTGGAPLDPEAYLRTAEEIGQHIVQRAVWHEGLCNWLGSAAGGELPGGVVFGALGPELYAGTSGVALFLAELAAVTGDVGSQRTALGAIRQALSQVEAIPDRERLGLFTGWTGIALAAARIGTILGDLALLEGASQLARRAVVAEQDAREFDLIYGHAGAIPALLVLGEMLDDQSFLDQAVRLGQQLVRMATPSRVGASWRSPSPRYRHNLTGFSHGTAGAAYALLELFRLTGESEFRATAESAFAYDRHWFDATRGNWPDFRGVTRRVSGDFVIPSSDAWCHGAPGIALSRIRVFEIRHDDACAAEAKIALASTRRATEQALESRTSNFCLCHGLAGNAEVLLEGSRVAELGSTADAALAHRVAAAGIEAYGGSPGRWPCGTTGETPSLMTGLAGIGLFHLRLYDRTTPSILLPRPEAFSRQRV